MDAESSAPPPMGNWLTRQAALGVTFGLLGLAGVLYLPIANGLVRGVLAAGLACVAVWALEALIRRRLPRLDALSRCDARHFDGPGRMALWGVLVWGVPMAAMMGALMAPDAGQPVASQVFGAPSLIWLAGGAGFGLIMYGFMKGAAFAAKRLGGR